MTIAVVILLFIWLMGIETAHTFGGLIHILFVAGLVIFVVNLFTARRLAS